MRGITGRLLAVATLATALVVGTAPAHAVDVPAYGTITITNDGAGVVPTWTYDPGIWSCRTEIVGAFLTPYEVTVTCDTNSNSFICPLMILTTNTRGGRAGGSTACTDSLDTGIISGVATERRSGHLGRAYSIRCRAYGGDTPLVAPYTVTCSEPGLPELGG